MRVSDIRELFVRARKCGDVVPDKGGGTTIELRGISFIADEDHIFGAPNHNYIARELEWYYSRICNINAIPAPIPRIWQNVAAPDGTINSNYGWCLFSTDNGSQYSHVVAELKENPYSRRAIAIYTRPQMWSDATRCGMSDFICTNTVQYILRNNILYAVVQMRSNDAWAGYRNDYAWQKHILEKLAGELDALPGSITWQVGSLHIYDRQYNLIDKYIESGETQ